MAIKSPCGDVEEAAEQVSRVQTISLDWRYELAIISNINET